MWAYVPWTGSAALRRISCGSPPPSAAVRLHHKPAPHPGGTISPPPTPGDYTSEGTGTASVPPTRYGRRDGNGSAHAAAPYPALVHPLPSAPLCRRQDATGHTYRVCLSRPSHTQEAAFVNLRIPTAVIGFRALSIERSHLHPITTAPEGTNLPAIPFLWLFLFLITLFYHEHHSPIKRQPFPLHSLHPPSRDVHPLPSMGQ